MDIKEKLSSFKKELDREIEKTLAKAIKEANSWDKIVAQALREVRDSILSGGKRLRPAFMYWGYLGAGGKERKKILETSVSIELIHNFLLIHDDIMDRDKKRHGRDTLNAFYEKVSKKYFPKKDSEHFGNSMAIIIGDLVSAMGNNIIFDSKFPPEKIMKALSGLQKIVSLTVVGQTKDIYMAHKGNPKEAEILEMYEYKTAKYTIEGPLHLGAILAGASEKTLEGLSRYSIPLGIAFQIQDDILGIFGSEKKLGKPVGSDIQEGKQTILSARALEKANSADRKKIKEIFKKEKISSDDTKEFREIIIRSGALEYARGKAKKYIQESKEALDNILLEKESKEFLSEIADYMIEREK